MTQRRESDTVEILSGVFEGRTTGTPIALLIRNEDQRSKDYANIADTFRPGHADYTYWQKYGIRDYRGGGRQSARETAVRVAAGAIARKWLRERYGVVIRGHLTQIGPNLIPFKDWRNVDANPFFVAERRRSCPSSKRSWIGCASRAIPAAPASTWSRPACPSAGGEPVYGKLDADLAAAMMSINAVKGVEIGAGFASVTQSGTEHSDEMTPEGFLSNHAGGILGGISTGQDIVVSIAVKPTSTIRLDRRSIDKAGEAGHRQYARSARPLRRHSRDADRRSDAGAHADRSRVAPSRAERRRRPHDAYDSGACVRRRQRTAGRRERGRRSRTRRGLSGALEC